MTDQVSLPPLFENAVSRGDTAALLAMASREMAQRWPEASALLLSLGLVGRVVMTDKEESACLQDNGGEFSIRLGRKFLLDVVRTPADLGYILAHELSHLILAHTTTVRKQPHLKNHRPFQRLIENVAGDALVCRLLHTRFRETPGIDERAHGSGTGLASALVATPETLLSESYVVGEPLDQKALADCFRQRALEQNLPLSLNKAHKLAEIYREIWCSMAPPSLADLAITLQDLLLPFADQLIPPPLTIKVLRELKISPRISSRFRLSRPMSAFPAAELPPDLLRLLPHDILDGDWQEELERQRNQQKRSCGKMQEEKVRGHSNTELVQRCARAMREFMERSPTFRQELRHQQTRMFRTPVPLTIGRREAFWFSMGLTAPLYDSPMNPAKVPEPVQVYVDVSGSMQGIWLPVLKAVQIVAAQRRIVAYQFSTEVAPLSLSDAVDIVVTTGSTDFDCVMNHLSASKMPHAFVITDGEAMLLQASATLARQKNKSVSLIVVGSPDDALESELKRMFTDLLAPQAPMFWLPMFTQNRRSVWF
jgi:hypothetical protein